MYMERIKTQNEQTEAEALNLIKGTLKQDFETAFGPDTLFKYYYGKVKKQKYDQNNKPMRKGDKPWLETKNFDPHFAHETLADKFGIKLGPLHIPILQPYFMAVALHKKTGNDLYRKFSEDMFEDFEVAAQASRLDGYDELTSENFNAIREAVDSTTDIMIERTSPILST